MAISMHIITADMEDIMNGEMRLEDGRIDLISLAETMWKQGRRFWWLLLLLAGIGAAACSFLVKKTYQPVYTAFAAYAVSSDSVYAGNKNYEQKVAEQIGVVFPYILTSDVLREKVCEKMGTKTMPGSIDASVVQDTNLITIRARAASAGRAYELLQAVLACYPEILHPVTGVLKMELLDESGVPHQPDNIPDGRRAALEGAAGGSLLFILIVLFGAMAKKTVRNREDLQRLTQIHYLGSLPKTRAKKRSAAFLDARYAICARLEKELKKKNMHTLLVTSAVAGEGKTTVACNLALGLEKKGYSVLLLDADLRKPAVCRTIQLDSGTEGAYEVLTGQRTAEEVKIRCRDTQLCVIAGTKSLSSTQQILGTGKIAEIIKQLEKTGSDYENILKRFGSEAMIQRFALKFLKDGSFSDLKNALEAKDGERAFRAAHTLKGVCINLGFDRLYNVSAELTEKLRGREIEESEELFEQVEKEYHALTAVLKQYESEL